MNSVAVSEHEREIMIPMACFPAKEKRAAARSASDLSGWMMSGIGLGVGGSGAIGKGVMYFNWP